MKKIIVILSLIFNGEIKGKNVTINLFTALDNLKVRTLQISFFTIYEKFKSKNAKNNFTILEKLLVKT